MKALLAIFALVILALFGVQAFLTMQPPLAGEPEPVPATDHRFARYLIDGQDIQLIDGVYQGTFGTVSLFGDPVVRDVDGDYDDDAVVTLVYSGGGSGTFYYIAAALKDGDEYVGTNAVLLGDRVAPQSVVVRNRVIMASYADRGADEPMAATPSVGKTAYIVYEDGALVRKAENALPGTQVLQGYYTWGAEVRSFRACGEGQAEHWVMGDPAVLEELRAVYERSTSGAPYAPLFVTIAGTIVAPPQDGFGADYEHAIMVSEVITADGRITCKSDTVVLTSPRAGALIESPITVTGYVRGFWAFEADFPVMIVDWDGRIIANGYATTLSDWMTEEYVPFLGTLTFESPASETDFSQRGTLILHKDNASGLPEHDDALEVPVRFRVVQ